MRSVVTGARGFIGRHVCGELESAGHEVVRLGRDAHGRLGEIDHDGSVRSAPYVDLLAGADAIVHLAAQLVVSPDDQVSGYLAANVALTDELLASAAAAGVPRAVLASSRLVYSPWLDRPATERDAPAPTSGYGLSKVFAEHVLQLYVRHDRISGVALRIGQVTGPGDVDRGVMAAFARAAAAGGPIHVSGRGLAVRDFVDVRDVAKAVRLASERATTAPAVNVGGGRGRTILELARAAASAAGLPQEAIERVSVDAEDISHWSLDVGLALDQLGWTPRWSAEDSLRDRISRLRREAAPGSLER